VQLFSILEHCRIPHVNNQDGEEVDFEESAKLWKEGKKKESKVIPFNPVFLSKDVFVMGVYLIFFFYLVFYHFEFAMDPVNFDPADGLRHQHTSILNGISYGVMKF